MQPRAVLLTAPIGRTITLLAGPNIVAMFFTMMTLVVGAGHVGHLGTASPAGLGLAFPMMMLA